MMKSLSDSACLRSTDFYWNSSGLPVTSQTKQDRNKLASSSSSMSNSENMANFATFYILNINCTLLSVQIRRMLPFVLMVFLFSSQVSSTNVMLFQCWSKMQQEPSITRRLLRPVQVLLRGIHAGAI